MFPTFPSIYLDGLAGKEKKQKIIESVKSKNVYYFSAKLYLN